MIKEGCSHVLFSRLPSDWYPKNFAASFGTDSSSETVSGLVRMDLSFKTTASCGTSFDSNNVCRFVRYGFLFQTSCGFMRSICGLCAFVRYTQYYCVLSFADNCIVYFPVKGFYALSLAKCIRSGIMKHRSGRSSTLLSKPSNENE